MCAITASAKLERVPLECRLAPQDVLRAVADDPLPFALTGDWAGGGAIVGSSPLTVADTEADPFALLDVLPGVDKQTRPGGAVGGGWFGWLGYRLGRRVEDLPEGRRVRPAPRVSPGLLRPRAASRPIGQWWFEALVGKGAGDGSSPAR